MARNWAISDLILRDFVFRNLFLFFFRLWEFEKFQKLLFAVRIDRNKQRTFEKLHRNKKENGEEEKEKDQTRKIKVIEKKLNKL